MPAMGACGMVRLSAALPAKRAIAALAIVEEPAEKGRVGRGVLTPVEMADSGGTRLAAESLMSDGRVTSLGKEPSLMRLRIWMSSFLTWRSSLDRCQ
jgi:hypothetical protein